MPWKVNGERWHLGDKGFPPGKRVQWDRALLPRMLELLRKVEPKVEIAWDNRLAVTFRVPGISRAWAQFRTKASEALDCRFLGKKGQFNLSQVEQFGVQPTIKPHGQGEILHLMLQHENHVHAAGIVELLREHVKGFREVWGV